MKKTPEPEPGSPVHQELDAAWQRVAALEERIEQLSRVLATARIGYGVLECGNMHLHANAVFCSEFGFAPDEQVQWAQLPERVIESGPVGFVEAMHDALEKDLDFDLQVQVRWPDGQQHWLHMQGRVAIDADGSRRLMLTLRNVDAEAGVRAAAAAAQATALESERRLRATAESANRGKDQFLSVFSHELRSPLNAILGWNRILALKRVDDAEVTSVTARIEHSARAQLKMVNDLLDLARIETGKLRIETRPMQMVKVAAVAVDLARPAAAAKHITLETQFEPGAGQVRGDPDRLQQVVSNLLSNAVKFTASSGSIKVSVRNTVADPDKHTAAATELIVEDTGQGIAPELLPHVFDRFRQGDSSSTRQAGGLGLGLALVREIVTLHGGTVTASSAGTGQGARFVASFPVRESSRHNVVFGAGPQTEADGSVLSRPSGLRSLTGLSILVVDDEPDARTVVAETLALEGARVTVTESAMSAMQKLQEADAHFDIIVTDIGMPDEDGYSLVRRLRTLQSGRRMLAIAVTGYASSRDVAAALDAGFDVHVPKPLDFNTFVPMVRRLAQRAAV